MGNMTKFLFLIAINLCALTLTNVFAIQFAFAEDVPKKSEEFIGGERSARAPAATTSNGISRKRYPGGADEDDLQVQATLPIPSRTLDGSALASAPADASDPESTQPPPAND